MSLEDISPTSAPKAPGGTAEASLDRDFEGVPMLGAEIIANAIVDRDISRVFVYPGGTIAPILEALHDRNVELFCSRAEQGAGFAAIAAARVTNKPQVVMVTSGPGVTNLVTPIADAFFDSVPLVVLAGQVGTPDLKRNDALRQKGFQEVDTVGLCKPIAKAVLRPMHANDTPRIIEEAFHIATTGRPGPVVIDVPMDVQRTGVTQEESTVREEQPRLDVMQQEIPAQTIETVASRIRSAQSPVVIAGYGVVLSDATQELRTLADQWNIPVSHSLPALGAYPTNSPLSLGFHGHTGSQVAGLALHHADLIIAVGSRLDIRQIGSEAAAFAPEAFLVRVDIDTTELHDTRVKCDLPVQADCKVFLAALNTALADAPSSDALAPWHARIAEWRNSHPLMPEQNGALKPQSVICAVDRLTSDHESVICTSGVGSHQQWTARHFSFDYPARQWLTSAGHGTMGYDLPAAIGAQLANPDATVCCFVGDGSLQMNIQELGAAAEHGLPIKVFVLDNSRLGIVSQFQLANWGRDLTTGGKVSNNFADIARAFGLWSCTVEKEADLEDAITQALAQPGPALVHCRIDPVEDVSPMLLGGQTLDKMWRTGDDT